MRTTVIPAQVTTVEDTIAGNLNLTQLLILMIPVFCTGIIYALFPTPMQITWYKAGLCLFILLLCIILALRIKGKVVLNWLIILATYNFRPRIYVFNKNDAHLRTLHLPAIERQNKEPFLAIKKIVHKRRSDSVVSTPNLVLAENYLRNQKFSVSFKLKKKGGLHVAFEPAH